ncbi:MAG: UbiX family flavin prenyltransferase, partial [Spirochaetales bacterium]|nr:UbiX family flavin prenyltransferase [Spirochaetales bacterium]
STLGAISNATPYNLLTRAADVCLKEKRRLILVPRESPLHQGHIRNLYRAAKYGSIILPPVLAVYNKPAGIDDIINSTIARILDLFDIEHDLSTRWGEE